MGRPAIGQGASRAGQGGPSPGRNSVEGLLCHACEAAELVARSARLRLPP